MDNTSFICCPHIELPGSSQDFKTVTRVPNSGDVCVCPGLPLKPPEFQHDPCSAPWLGAPWQLHHCLSCAVPRQPKRGDTRRDGGRGGIPNGVTPHSTRRDVDEDQGEQGNFGVPNRMFPQCKVRWLKKKGVIKEDPFSQRSLAHHSCKHGTR